MITIGSINREDACIEFPFLTAKYRGKRKAIKEFTHQAPEYVFWIFPDGTLFDAKEAYKKNIPKGYERILSDEPEYCGFLRGRVASNYGPQIIVVYCREDALANDILKMKQFLDGIEQLPIPIKKDTLVVSDNADMYGTVCDIRQRVRKVS